MSYKSYLILVLNCFVYSETFFITPGRVYYTHMILHKFNNNKKHIETIKNKSSIDIFTSELRNNYPRNSDIACSLFHSYTEYPIYTEDFIEQFKNKWKTNVYTKKNYPLTYDTIKPINVSSNILNDYRETFCSLKQSNTNIVFWFSVIPIILFAFLIII